MIEKVLYLICVVKLTAGFLLDNKACPVTAPAPCECGYNIVSCQAKALIDVPQFHAVANSVFTKNMDIDLSENQLSSIPQAAFQTFAVINNSVTLDLQKNQIKAIDNNAFTGIEDKLQYLILSYNRLSTLPLALLKLTSLKNLIIDANPLTHLDASMMYALSPTLGVFDLSMDNFKSWPTEIGMIEDLGNLHVRGGHFSNFPQYPFGNLVHTLYSLNIYNSNIEFLPRDICYFKQLSKITILNSTRLGQSSNFFEKCNTPNLIVTDIQLIQSNLRRFPDLTSFPSVSRLNLRNNSISYINSDEVPINNTLYIIYLSQNNFRRIPFAINKMTKLYTIDISFNEITSIEENDFQGVTNLRYIDLSNNPVMYISRRSFENNLKLRTLHLDSTNLISVPEAVVRFPTSLHISFNKGKVVCNCDMSSNLQNATLRIDGLCNNKVNTTIQNYLIHSLPHCP